MRDEWPGIEVSVDEETAEGAASNIVVVRPGDEAVVLDFLLSSGYVSQARLQSRIVLTEKVARQLKQALERSLPEEAAPGGRTPDEGTPYN